MDGHLVVGIGNIYASESLFRAGISPLRAASRISRLRCAVLVDAVRATNDETPLFSFWDYQAGAWQKNNGIRIDHLMLSPEASDRLRSTAIEKHVRAWEKPSDHVPVVGHFAF